MRKCPDCGSINTDDKRVCGVCGTSLAETASLSLRQAEQLPDPAFHPKKEVDRVGMLGLLVGIAVLMSGLAVLFIEGPFSLLGFGLSAFGVILMVSGVNTVARRPYRATFGGYRPTRPSGSGRDYIAREAGREEQEEEDRKSGAAD